MKEIEALRRMVDGLPMMLAQVDAQERYIQVNRSYARLYGLAAEDFPGRSVAGIIGQEMYDRIRDRIRTVLQGHEVSFEEELPSPEGGVVLLRVTYIPHLDGQGKVLSASALIQDVTEQRRIETELERSRETVRLLVENARDCIFHMRIPDGVYEYVSPAVEDLCGYPPEVFYNNPKFVWSCIHPDSQDYLAQTWARMLQGDVPDAYLFKITHPVKGERWVQQRNRLVTDDQGVPVALEGVVTDVTAMKCKEQELSRAKEEAEAASRAKSEFLARVSHETRTPLHAILGQAGLALEQARDSAMSRRIQTIQDSAGQLHAMISDILDYASLEIGGEQPAADPLELPDLCRRTADLFRSQARDKGLDLRVDIRSGVPVRVKSDSRRLRQILTHLLSNAVKFTEAGEVSLEVAPEAGDRAAEDVAEYGRAQTPPESRVRFTVRDTGPGVEAEDTSAIFEEFHQANGGLENRPQGLGLGLAMASRITELLGGRLDMASEPGRGSVFSFRLDLERDEEPEEPERPEPGDVVSRLRILLAEDNPLNASLMAEWLARAGHTPVLAADGREALELLREGPCDLVLMDLEMPRMNGLEASRRIRNGEAGEPVREVPVYAITAHVLPEFQRRCEAAGMDGFLSKPVDMEKLAPILNGVRPAVGREAGSDMDAEGLPDREDHLREFGGNQEFVNKLYTMFRRQSSKEAALIREALGHGNMEAVTRAAHSMKNSALGLGASRLADLAEDLQNHSGDAAGAARKLERIERELARVLDWIG